MAAACAGCVSVPGWARDHAQRPITFLMPFAAGGGPDLVGRQQAQALARALGCAVIVENRPGAGGSVAAQAVARAAPDGHTLMLGASSHVINKLATPSLAFSPLDDFTHVSLCWRAASVLVVAPESPYLSVKELVAAAHARPGALSYASGGVGTVAHLAGGAFAHVLGMDAAHVPYRGSVDIAPALLRGDVAFAFPIASTAMPAIGNGQVRPLAVTGAQRLEVLPDVPTLLELYRDPLLEQEAWGGLWLPRGAAASVVRPLFDANAASLHEAALRSQFAARAVTPVASASPGEFAAFVASETVKWRRVLGLLGLLPAR